MEEDEDEEEAADAPAIVPVEHSPVSEGGASPDVQLPENVVDVEVAKWVVEAIAKRKAGKLGKSEKPALHAAPLDAVTSPIAERTMLNGAEALPISQPPAGPALDEEDKVAVEDHAAPTEE